MTWDEVWADPRNWVPEAVGGALVLVLGLSEALTTHYVSSQTRLGLLWIALLTALAVSLSRRVPSAALGTRRLSETANAVSSAIQIRPRRVCEVT